MKTEFLQKFSYEWGFEELHDRHDNYNNKWYVVEWLTDWHEEAKDLTIAGLINAYNPIFMHKLLFIDGVTAGCLLSVESDYAHLVVTKFIKGVPTISVWSLRFE